MIKREFKKGDKVTVTKTVVKNAVVKQGMEGEVIGFYPPIPLTDDKGLKTGEIAISYDVKFPSGTFIVHQEQMALTKDLDIEQFRLE